MFIRTLHCSRSSLWSFSFFHQVQRREAARSQAATSWNFASHLIFIEAKLLKCKEGFLLTLLSSNNEARNEGVAWRAGWSWHSGLSRHNIGPYNYKYFKICCNIKKKSNYMISDCCTMVRNGCQLDDTTVIITVYSKRRTTRKTKLNQ